MVALDMRTVVFSSVVTDLTITFVMLGFWIQNKKRYKGGALFVMDFAFQSVALILIALRGIIPDWISMVVSNTFVVIGALMGLIGLEKFLEVKGKHIQNFILLAVFVFVHSWFSLVNPELPVRNLNISSALFLVTLECVWLLFHKVKGSKRKLTFEIGLVFAAYAFLNFVRIANFFLTKQSDIDYFQSGKFEYFALIIYQVLFILLAYSLVLLFNRRLITDLSSQEEMFSRAFFSAPYGIALTRISDGKIYQVNQGFVEIIGYSVSEAVGSTAKDLNVWPGENDRAAFVKEVIKLGKIHEKECQFRKKTGEIFDCLISAEVLTINNEKVMLISINDISERKQNENLLNDKISELEKFNKMMVGRELRMVELKREINELCGFLKIPLRYKAGEEANR
jgi:PAS domain S-box-containing protein